MTLQFVQFWLIIIKTSILQVYGSILSNTRNSLKLFTCFNAVIGKQTLISTSKLPHFQSQTDPKIEDGKLHKQTQ